MNQVMGDGIMALFGAPVAPDLYDFLSQELSGAEKIKVVLDRRRGDQRLRFEELTEERRRAERRREQLDQDLRDWGFAVAPRRHG